MVLGLKTDDSALKIGHVFGTSFGFPIQSDFRYPKLMRKYSNLKTREKIKMNHILTENSIFLKERMYGPNLLIC